MRETKPTPLRPLGHQQITSLGAATALTVPRFARYARITCSGQPVRFRDDGTNPTAAIGIIIPVNTPFFYDGDLSTIKFIETAVSATLDISYYQ